MLSYIPVCAGSPVVRFSRDMAQVIKVGTGWSCLIETSPASAYNMHVLIGCSIHVLIVIGPL